MATKKKQQVVRQGIALVVSDKKKTVVKKKAAVKEPQSSAEKSFRRHHKIGEVFFVDWYGPVIIRKVDKLAVNTFNLTVESVHCHQMNGKPFKRTEVRPYFIEVRLARFNVADFLKKTNKLYKEVFNL